MKITIIGTGYVGLVTGTCFAEMGNDVTCVDIDRRKIEMLKNGVIPFYEPGLEELVQKNIHDKRLSFSTSLPDAIKNTEIIFSAVNTPQGEDGAADLRRVMEVGRELGQIAESDFLLVNKSTVPVGTGAKVKKLIREELDKRGVRLNFDVASNPEFLKEGAAIKDFMSPDRVVIGTDNEHTKAVLEKLYKPFMLKGERFIFMDVASAELTKYAANAMLATRISFMNEIASLCESVGADIDMIRSGIGSDDRIGRKFLYAGAGYGGSCFPKDVRALVSTGVEHGVDMRMIRTVDEVNEAQKKVIPRKVTEALGGSVKGKTIAIWGLSYKPDTDDMREAPSITLIRTLLANDAIVKVYDPVAMTTASEYFADEVTYCDSKYDAAIDADALVLMTEWREFRIPAWKEIKGIMKGNVVIDGRNIYDANELKAEGFIYSRIGSKP